MPENENNFLLYLVKWCNVKICNYMTACTTNNYVNKLQIGLKLTEIALNLNSLDSTIKNVHGVRNV